MFAFDVLSRRIVDWRAATAMTTALVLDCREHAGRTRRRDGVTDSPLRRVKAVGLNPLEAVFVRGSFRYSG